jgi:hypothetical protein
VVVEWAVSRAGGGLLGVRRWGGRVHLVGVVAADWTVVAADWTVVAADWTVVATADWTGLLLQWRRPFLLLLAISIVVVALRGGRVLLLRRRTCWLVVVAGAAAPSRCLTQSTGFDSSTKGEFIVVSYRLMMRDFSNNLLITKGEYNLLTMGVVVCSLF